MSDNTKRREKRWSANLPGTLLRLCLIVGVCAGLVFAETDTSTSDDRKLQNGSFEEIKNVTIDTTKKYLQTSKDNVSNWETTAYDKGLIELFIENNGTYIQNPKATLKPTDGHNAAELNADEESTLYQIVSTTPASIYEWGLDHGARNYADTMALVIGPSQSVAPSKPSKTGRDQLMQMVDWLIKQGKTSVKTSTGIEKQLIVYSKKFAENGSFDGSASDPFSLTPSTVYTEEWHIWIIADMKAQSGELENPWGHYGSNAVSSDENSNESGSTGEELLGKDYLYTVPAKQTKTLFGFVSVGCVTDKNGTPNSDKTYGNFLDNINFQLYHPLSGSSTNHGSAVVGGSDGTIEGEGADKGHEISVDNKLTTYVTDGKTLKVQAVVKKADAENGCEFVGLYYTVQDENGNPKPKFLQLAGKEIEDTGSLTDEEKKGKWIKSTNTDGDTVYTYYLDNITSATDLHFIFIKSPTVTYDPNGGNPYIVNRTYNTDEEENVYSFKPAIIEENTNGSTSEEVDAVSGATPIDKPKQMFISPYVSKAAEGQNDGWKFMGWLLTGDIVVEENGNVVTDQKKGLGTLVLPAVHTIACDYSIAGAAGQSSAQNFKIFNGNVSLTEEIEKDGTKIKGVTWTPESNNIKANYTNVHKGLTMVAQWRWRQAFIPQVNSDDIYIDSNVGGTVEITSVTDASDTNYNAIYNDTGGKSYHATTDEIITATATATENYTFEGWYDSDGNLLTKNATYGYIETKGAVNTYYARFSGSVKQTYIRQVKTTNGWEVTKDDAIGKLTPYTYSDVVGTVASSTAIEGTDYKFVGWYDSAEDNANLVTKATTISYTTTGNATYYARFETGYTVYFKTETEYPDGSIKKDTTGGTVSVASVKDVDGKSASSKATANEGYKFIGWYDKDGNQLGSNATYSTKTTSATNGAIYYARFTWVYQVENKAYLSFVAEGESVNIPPAFNGRDAGTGKNATEYGLDNKCGNTISTGFKYKIADMTNVSTIQITISVPKTAYVKVGGTGSFTGDGTPVLTDSAGVEYNKGSIQKIKAATTLKYYWDATGLQEDTYYGFIIDNLYAPGATATITVNGRSGTQVTSSNGVVNTSSANYRSSSHYPK